MKILLNVLIILLVLFIISVLISFLVVEMFFLRNKSQSEDITKMDPSKIDREAYRKSLEEAQKGIKYLESMDMEDLSLKARDGLMPKAWYLPAEKETDKCVICVHGYRSFGAKDFGDRAEYMHSLGWNILMVDDRAHGRSEGKYIGFGILDAWDVRDWCDLIIEKLGKDCTLVLHGISMGSATVLNVSGLDDLPKNVKGLIADCGFSSGIDEACFQLKKWIHLPKVPFYYLAALWLKILAHYDLGAMEAKKQIKKFKGKLLVIHGGDDDFVPTYMGQEIFDAAECEKELFIVEGALHATSYVSDTEGYQQKIKGFLAKML